MSEHPRGFEDLARQSALQPQEKPALVKDSTRQLVIGIPKESSTEEKRVPLTPAGVEVLSHHGFEILIESGAGVQAHYADHEYAEAGAKIVYSSKEIFESEQVIKVEPPSHQELSWMKSGKSLISALQIGIQTPEFLNLINDKRLTAVAYEFIEDKVGGLPTVRAMSEIAGTSAMLVAAECLSSSSNGKGIILGGITGVPPAKVVILGAGTVSEFAARTAFGLGAEVKIFDNQIYRLRRIKHALSQQVYTSTFDTATLKKAIANADVVIGAVRAEKGQPRFIVSEDMVAEMKPGSVIIDVSIDQGGCIETSELTSHSHPFISKHGVIHYGVPNIASRVARTASQALSNIFTPIFIQIANCGGFEDMIFSHKWFMKGVYTYRGNLTHPQLARKFGLKYKDLNLLLASRI